MNLKTMARFIRLQQGRTGADVAAAAGVALAKYRQFEAGTQYRRLNPDELARVAAELDVPADTIADDRGFPLRFVPKLTAAGGVAFHDEMAANA